MVKILKDFFKPAWKKIILFFILFLLMFFGLPFVSISTGGTKSVFWLLKNYSGQKQDLAIILSGIITYFVVAYFVSCLAFAVKVNFKKNE